MLLRMLCLFFFSSRRRQTRCALVTGVQTCALPICLWQRKARVDAARIDALAWTAALNLARNRLRWRRLRGWPVAPETADAVAGEDDPQASAEQARLHAALRRLPVAMLEVVLMAEFSGMDTREIAPALGIAEGTVASHMHGEVLRLKQRLGRHRRHEIG